MKRLSWMFVALICLAPSQQLFADEKKTEIESIIAAGRDGNRVMEHMDYLTNRFGPRLTSSDGLQHASEWAKETFASFGLDARLEEWGEFPVGFNRGPWFGRMVTPTEKTLQFGTPSWSAGTRGVVRAKTVLPPENADQLEAFRQKLPGSWYLTRRPGASLPRELQQKVDETVNQTKIAGTIRSTSGELIHTSGNWRISWDNLPTTPSILLLKKQYDEIAESLTKGQDVELEFDIRNYFRKGPVKLYNVIADLPGTEKPDEYVIIGGHIDGWDGATGSMDNATGCACVIEVARILTQAGVKPRRTIRFMLWSGEEQGLLGSAAYVKAHPELMPKISAVIVHDGGTNYVSGILATEAMAADMDQAFGPVKELNPQMPFQVRKVPGLPAGIGSDHDSFLRAGVPGFYLMQSGRAGYTRIHHTQFDTFEGAVPEYLEHSSIVMAVGAFGLANLDNLLARDNLVAARTPRGRRIGVNLDENLKVEGIVEGFPAEKAGIKVGDVIAKVDGQKIDDPDHLVREIQKGGPKKTIAVIRDGKEVNVSVEWPNTKSN